MNRKECLTTDGRLFPARLPTTFRHIENSGSGVSMCHNVKRLFC